MLHKSWQILEGNLLKHRSLSQDLQWWGMLRICAATCCFLSLHVAPRLCRRRCSLQMKVWVKRSGWLNDVTLPSMYHYDSWCIQYVSLSQEKQQRNYRSAEDNSEVMDSHGLYSLGLTGPISMSISANLSVKFWHFGNLWHMLLPQ